MILLPPRCGACRRRGPSPCPPCREHLVATPPLVPPPPLSALIALLVYEGGARPLVAGLKVSHNRTAQPWLATGLALLLPHGVGLITWAPTSPSRVAARGADHARLLAQGVAQAAGLRVHGTLDRLPGPQQTGRSRVERLAHGPSFTGRYDLSGLTVAVVDDITTTGATLAAAGRAVIAAGATRAIGLAAAATLPGPRPPRGASEIQPTRSAASGRH